ncbi:MAG TPA: hypothetical protein PKO06_04405, partial [Candidatus Ozemobacteraceae bacterium]|nr:hypothetical protein [Candidatus Ozemobacteraceae bacterium]
MMQLRGRRGFSIPLAILGGGMIAIVMTALSFYSQGEMRSVRHMLDSTTGEYLAYSGLIWSYDKLCREGRWYQPAENSIKERGHQWQNSWKGTPDLAIPGNGNAGGPQISVFFDEIRSTHTLKLPGKTINPGNATPGLPLLDHIDSLPLDRPDGRIEQAKRAFDRLPAGLTHFLIHASADTPELRAITPDAPSRIADYQAF